MQTGIFNFNPALTVPLIVPFLACKKENSKLKALLCLGLFQIIYQDKSC